jgi:hypothetical protein
VPFLRRTFEPQLIEGSLVNRSWLQPLVRLSAIDSAGFTWCPERGSLPRPEEDDRVYVHLVVAGRLHRLSTGEVLEPGSGLVTSSYRAAFEEDALAFVGAHRAVALRLDRRLVRHTSSGIVHAPLEVLVTIQRSLRRTRSRAAAHGMVVELLELLRIDGLPVVDDAVELIEGSVDEGDGDAIADRLSHALTVSTLLPAWVDLTSAGPPQSERQVRRRLGAFLRRYGMPFASWRELRQSFCLTIAALAMSLPEARTDVVARTAGFASPSSLCHALQRAGLGTPQQIARQAALLRRAL